MSKLSEFNCEEKNEQNREELLKRKYDSFKNMSKEQLNAELLKEVARQKSSGVFDYQNLSEMVERLKGALPMSDYQNIKRILESLK